MRSVDQLPLDVVLSADGFAIIVKFTGAGSSATVAATISVPAAPDDANTGTVNGFAVAVPTVTACEWPLPSETAAATSGAVRELPHAESAPAVPVSTRHLAFVFVAV